VFKKILYGSLIVLLMAGAWFYRFGLWGSHSRPALPEALAALNATQTVQVTTGKWDIFSPQEADPAIGLIFYPGGRVDSRSYAPTLAAIAAEGYLVVNVPMPFDLAVYGWEQASDVIAEFPEIKTWVIGGHSMGGRMAARYTKQHPADISGLLLWGAYPSYDDDLSGANLAVLTIYGSLEGGVWRIKRGAGLLPEDAGWVEIEGGSHNQFGYYASEPGDRLAAISQAEQQAIILKATLSFLAGLGE